ncbi:MAG: hypothetical protein DMF78_03325 [Acidobacteria bacterium]|nr:MAG: hypothetical protein DMF78_03325 [Acidobacteriota bacterium]
MVALLATGAVASTPAYSQTTVTTDQPTIVMGEVVRYEPGRIIVLRNAENNEVTYMLTPKIMVPAGVAVGRPVTLYTTHGEDGAWTVTRVSTSVTPEGNVQRTVERTRTNAEGETTRSTSTEVIGTVRGFEPGHSITVVRPDGTEVTYMINERTHLPANLAIGRTIMLRPAVVTDNSMVADTVTYTETKTKTEHGRTTTRTKSKTKKVS